RGHAGGGPDGPDAERPAPAAHHQPGPLGRDLRGPAQGPRQGARGSLQDLSQPGPGAGRGGPVAGRRRGGRARGRAADALLAAAGTPDDPNMQTTEVLIALNNVFLAVPIVLALIGVVRRAGWGLVMSWVSAVLLCLTCVGLVLGIPIMVFAARTRF